MNRLLTRCLLVSAIAVCAAGLSANSSWNPSLWPRHVWGYESLISWLLGLSVLVSATLLLETLALFLAKPVRPVGKGAERQLRRVGWNRVLGIVILINVVSFLIGTPVALAATIAMGESGFSELLVAYYLLNFVVTLLIESLVVSSIVVWTSRVFFALFLANLVTASLPIVLMPLLKPFFQYLHLM